MKRARRKTPSAAVRDRASVPRLRLALEAAQMGTYDWDIRRGRITWSRWHEQLWGFKPGEFGGTYEEFASRVHPDDLAGINAEVARCIAASEPFTREFRVVLPDGTQHWILGRGDFRFGRDGQPVRMLGVVKEITDRKRLESALRESEKRYRALIEHSHDAILFLSSNGSVSYVSPSTTTVLGYLPEELLGRPALEFVRSDCRETVAAWLAESASHPGLAVAARAYVSHSDGDWLFLEGYLTNLLHEPAVGAIVINFRDVTARQRMEQALQESEEKFSKAFHANPAMIVITTADGRNVDFNAAYARLIDRSPPEMLGKTATELMLLDATERQKVLDLIDRGGGSIHNVEVAIRASTGRTMHVLLSSEAITLRGIPHRLTTVLDVSARKLAEEELRDLNRRLMEAQDASRRALARELHDRVGQNLTALNLNLSILQNHLPSEPAHPSRARLHDSLDLVAETMERVRNVMADLRPPALDDYGLAAALRWRGRLFAERSGITVTVDSDEPPVRWLPIVETALFRIAEEALTNVGRHAQANAVRVTLATTADGGRLDIRDDGQGFEPSSLAGRACWGLASMRERADAVGGRFRIDSRPGFGTTVSVEFPRNA